MGIVNRAYSDEGSVNSALNRRGIDFATVAEMVADTKIKLGQFVACADYANGNNSGFLFFKAVAAGTGTDDEGSYIDSVGSPSVQFKQNFPKVISIKMFGAAGLGGDYSVQIQRAINYVYDSQINELYGPPGLYGYTGMIVVPDNIKFSGAGKDLTVFSRLDASNTRGFIVGTYGPGSAAESPAAETYYSINNASEREGIVTLVTSADALNFSVGDIIGIEGNTVLYGTFQLPNMINEVVGISGGVLSLKYPIDEDYTSPRICKLNNNTASALVDSTGREWPLLVAVNTVIKDMTIKTTDTTGWAAVNLSTYKTVFENVKFIGLKGMHGNPVARTKFIKGCEVEYKHSFYEFAYYTHDTDLTEITATRVADMADGSVSAWTNSGEGAKRVNLLDVKIFDGDTAIKQTSVYVGADSNVNNLELVTGQAGVFGSRGAKISDSNIDWGDSFGVNGFHDGSISTNRIKSDSATGYAVLINNSGRPLVRGNVLGKEGSRTAVDAIYNVNGIDQTSVSENTTFYSAVPLLNAYSTVLNESGGEVELGRLTVAAGTVAEKDEFSGGIAFSADSGTALEIRVNDVSVASIAIDGVGDDCSADFKLFAMGPTGTRFTIIVNVNDHGTMKSVCKQVYPVAWGLMTDLSVHITGMVAATTSTRQMVSLKKLGHRTY